MRANTNIQLKERLQLKLEDFKGVDFSTSPLRVQANRASNMANFINENGVNRKRPGWNELFRIVDSNGSPRRINNIITFINGSHKEMLVHAGTRFFRINFNATTKTYSYTDITLSGTYAPSQVDATLIKDQRSQAFINEGRCYIVGCGDFLVYGTWDNGATYELRRVADDVDTYIPTTTVSIDDDSVTADTRSSLDDVNLLCSRRINQLLGSSSANKTWTLDSGKIDSDTEVIITLETLENDIAVEYVIKNNQSDKTKLYKVEKDGIAMTALECGSLAYETGKITLSMSTTPQIEGRDNIFVNFQCAVEGYIDRIANCKFGTQFGLNGNTDTLFCAGNEDYPNIDFHSEMDDYTYFGDQNTAVLGSPAYSIKGYSRLNDATLAIFKDSINCEPNIFYRTSSYKEQYDSNGVLSKAKIYYPITAGTAGEGCLNSFTSHGFNSESIILSRNGVFGVVLANNVATSERYTRERSRSINEKLKTHTDLSDAVGIVYKNKYYLSVDDVCYVADARFKYSTADDLDGSYNYEWWYWDNIPARVWANIDNTLYFGSKNGQVCVFDETHTDKTYQSNSSGDLAIDIANNKITYNSNIDIGLAENDNIEFYTDGIYSLFLEEFTVANGKIYLTEEEILDIYDGVEAYADNVGESGLEVSTKYYISGVDRGQCCFELIDESNVAVALASGGFRLHRLISKKELYLANVTESSFQLKDYFTSKIFVLTQYNNSVASNPLAKFTHKENVVARWYTPIFDFGTNESSKTLLKLTISTEPEVNGRINFGYETKDVDRLLAAKGVNVFSFDNFSFESFSFNTSFASSYSIKTKKRNFNFIVFRFISDSEYDCVVNNLTIVYKINKANKGVK